MKYLEMVNHKNFREASRKIHEARVLLKGMGMTDKETNDWLKAWVSDSTVHMVNTESTRSNLSSTLPNQKR